VEKTFVRKMTACNILIESFTGSHAVKWKGTWKFSIDDDNGIKKVIEINNTLYC